MAQQYMPAVSIDVNIFWQIINFFILVFVFNKYFKAPLKKVLDARKQKIAADLMSAQADKHDAARAKDEAMDILKNAKREAGDIIQLAEKKADERKEQILKEANTQREKMIKSAEVEVEKMKESARKELQTEMTALAVKLAEKMIKEKLDNQLNASLVDDFINEVGEAK